MTGIYNRAWVVRLPGAVQVGDQIAVKTKSGKLKRHTVKVVLETIELGDHIETLVWV